jgi:hypothetical protein
VEKDEQTSEATAHSFSSKELSVAFLFVPNKIFGYVVFAYLRATLKGVAWHV